MIKIKKQILFGILLGDANLQTYTGGKNWRIRFLQSDKNKDYLFHLYHVFNEYVKTPPKKSYTKKSKILSYNKIYSRWSFNTTVQPIALEFSKLFYNNNKKHMPSKEYLLKYLTPLAIAYWFMDHGSLKSNCSSYYLCTDNFKLNELKLVKEVFKQKYNIDINFHKKRLNYRVYIGTRESKKFYNLIEKYICKSMRYKLAESHKIIK